MKTANRAVRASGHPTQPRAAEPQPKLCHAILAVLGHGRDARGTGRLRPDSADHPARIGVGNQAVIGVACRLLGKMIICGRRKRPLTTLHDGVSQETQSHEIAEAMAAGSPFVMREQL